MRQIHRLLCVPHVPQRLVLLLLDSMQWRHTGHEVSPQCLRHSPWKRWLHTCCCCARTGARMCVGGEGGEGGGRAADVQHTRAHDTQGVSAERAARCGTGWLSDTCSACSKMTAPDAAPLTVVTMPLMCSSKRSKHTGHVGSSVVPGGGSSQCSCGCRPLLPAAPAFGVAVAADAPAPAPPTAAA
jgi:hypothetical protein